MVQPLAGSSLAGLQDGPASSAQFSFACGLAYDASSDTLFVADSGNHALRAIRNTHDTVQPYRSRHHNGSPVAPAPHTTATHDDAAAAAVCADMEVAIADADDLLRGATSGWNAAAGSGAPNRS